MNLEEARKLLGLPATATKREVKAAYRRSARRWHPDVAQAGEEAAYRARMQEVNAAYRYIQKFLEDYRYMLEEPPAAQEDYEAWWQAHFGDTFRAGGTRKPRRGPPE